MPDPTTPTEEIVLPDTTVDGSSRLVPNLAVMAAFLWLGVALAAGSMGYWHGVSALISLGAACVGVLEAFYILWFLGLRLTRGREHARAVAERHMKLSVHGRLVLDAHGLSIDGLLIARRNDVTRGLVEPLLAGRGRLVLRCRPRLMSRWIGPVTLDVSDVAGARGLARALGTDLSSTIVESEVRSPLPVWTSAAAGLVGCAVAASALVHPEHLWLYLAPLFACPLVIVVMALVQRPATLRIGTDGVEYRWAGRRRFVPYREVVELLDEPPSPATRTWSTSVMTLQLRDGSRVVWRLVDSSLVVTRLREALEAHRSNLSQDGAAWLARKDRAHEDWVRELRVIGSGGGRSYRASPPSREMLWRFVEDPAADVAVRAASAIALGPSLDDTGRARMRVAAKVTLLPELRVVLEREAAAEEAQAEEALEMLDRKHAAALQPP